MNYINFILKVFKAPCKVQSSSFYFHCIVDLILLHVSFGLVEFLIWLSIYQHHNVRKIFPGASKHYWKISQKIPEDSKKLPKLPGIFHNCQRLLESFWKCRRPLNTTERVLKKYQKPLKRSSKILQICQMPLESFWKGQRPEHY